MGHGLSVDSLGNYYFQNTSRNPFVFSDGTEFNIGEALTQHSASNLQTIADKYSKKRNQNTCGYNLGRVDRNNGRIIDTDSVMGGGTSGKIHGRVRFGNYTFEMPESQNNRYENTTDGYIGDSRQAKRGDCYFLAEINAIRNTKKGQQILRNNCRQNRDGSYTITLPGAIKIKNAYAAKGCPCEVTGTYTITKEALQKAGNSSKYSKGDLEVVAFELAMEAYRAEMYATNRQNGNRRHDPTTAQGSVQFNTFGNGGDVLSAGFEWDAAYILTGEKSEVYSANGRRYNNVLKYTDGKYGYITREEMARRTNADISMYDKDMVPLGAKSSEPVISEITSFSQNEQCINSMLNKYEGKEGEYALTFGVRVAIAGQDGYTKKNDGHALTVVKITKSTVYVSNPWHPDKIEPIPRNDFVRMVTSFQASPVRAGSTPSPQKPTISDDTIQKMKDYFMRKIR